MRYIGKLNSLDNLVIKDPYYSEYVPCQYSNKHLNFNNTDVILDFIDNEEYSCIDMRIVLKRSDCNFKLIGNKMSYPQKNKINKYSIGMDSACVAIGADLKAEEILSNAGEWQPEYALTTGTDGTFGTVYEGIEHKDTGPYENIVNFIFIDGWIDSDMCSEKELVKYFEEQLYIQDLKKVNDKEEEIFL